LGLKGLVVVVVVVIVVVVVVVICLSHDGSNSDLDY
jgi:hypothetical protein